MQTKSWFLVLVVPGKPLICSVDASLVPRQKTSANLITVLDGELHGRYPWSAAKGTGHHSTGRYVACSIRWSGCQQHGGTSRILGGSHKAACVKQPAGNGRFETDWAAGSALSVPESATACAAAHWAKLFICAVPQLSVSQSPAGSR
ncbi:uncharacterized protein B0I36DRAFT_343485 [Microdochium trichocladiopsis]|uniref:Uncharacterized protein n=1 Tax=Microdochium trichocladiopsis TaxID=1682393 RepID=A0A9P8YGK9_9PEZI|nr:uncharacterized protein B0I36DRAFT_343485 [Microdochium trichocladiopsis]KAH7039622.1 hypothetical protein B0I36DRAFT_343485 [Microdochium trichocladiopsis]